MTNVISKISGMVVACGLVLAGVQACGDDSNDQPSTVEPTRGDGEQGIKSTPTAGPTSSPTSAPLGGPAVGPSVEPPAVPTSAPGADSTIVPPNPSADSNRALSLMTEDTSCSTCHGRWYRGDKATILATLKGRRERLVAKVAPPPEGTATMPPQNDGVRQLTDEERAFLVNWFKTSPDLQ